MDNKTTSNNALRIISGNKSHIASKGTISVLIADRPQASIRSPTSLNSE